jgi:hypothetical protein
MTGMNTYQRGADTMVEYMPGCFVSRVPGERLGILARSMPEPPPPSKVPAAEPEFEPTAAQKRTIKMLAKLGSTTSEIAKTVGVPLATVKKYRR